MDWGIEKAVQGTRACFLVNRRMYAVQAQK
jgi:hypothetical protein